MKFELYFFFIYLFFYGENWSVLASGQRHKVHVHFNRKCISPNIYQNIPSKVYFIMSVDKENL